MPAVTVQDLDNAKSDCDTIATIATSLLNTTTDRLGNLKLTMTGAVNSMLAMNPRGAWATATAYNPRDLVVQGGVTYIVTVAHTSGTFATDLAAGKLAVYQGVIGNDLANQSDPTKGAALVGFDGGTLADFLKTKNNRVVASIAALQALDVAKYTRAFALGYYADGDGGGGQYWYDASDTTSTHNGGTILTSSTGSGRWKLAQKAGVSVQQFGAKADGTTDATAAITAALAWAASSGAALSISGTYAVTKIVIPNGVRHLRCDGILLGQSSGSYSAVLEIKNVTDFAVTGSLLVSGVYNTGYACGIKVWADVAGGCSLLVFQNVCVAGAQVGWQWGDSAQVDRLVSEIAIFGGYTYGCPIACASYGTQTFYNYFGYQLQSSTGSGSGAWTSLSRRCVIAVAANATVTGGEMLMTDTTGGAAIELDPITSLAYPNRYGTVRCDGVTIECASPFAVTGAAGVSSPVGGLLSFNACTGIHTQNLQPLIQWDSSFTGDIVCQGNNFYSTVARSVSNMSGTGAANIWCDDKSFGANFMSALAGISGGIPHFSRRVILRAQNLSGASFSSNVATDMKFVSLDNAGDMARFSTAYSTGTGIFTVPAGGLKDVEVCAEIYHANFANIDIYIYVNGTALAAVSGVRGANVKASLGALAAGTQVKAVAVSYGTSVSVGSNAWDFMHITARN